MKESYWGYMILVLGIFVLVIMIAMQNLSTTNEEDYYLAQEIMESAMIDSVDYAAYRSSGDIRIIKEKFVETFVRRFAESATKDTTYKIEFYNIYEYPPLASIKISTATGDVTIATGSSASFSVVNTLTGTLESKFYKN